MNARSWRQVCATLLLATSLVVLLAGSVLAAGTSQPDTSSVLEDTTASLNTLFVVIAAFLIFFMQAGFALVETGFTRAKNVANTMMMVLLCIPLTALCYWVVGFGLQFGGITHIYADVNDIGEWSYAPITLGNWDGLLNSEFMIGEHGIFGMNGFLLSGVGANFGIMAFFFFQLCFLAAAAAIPTGAMAERLKFGGYVLTTIMISVLIYPLIGNWIWGGGWLSNLGRTMGLGNGAIDYSGSGVIHMLGGSVALAGAVVLGPRIGKFNRDGSANVIAGHNVPMGILGTFILFLGWFAFNAGSAYGFTGGFRNLAINAIVTTVLAGSSGCVAAMCYMWFVSPMRRPDPVMTVNGLLAGTVAITAPCAFVEIWAAVVIGAIAGILCCLATTLLDILKIDDPVGAVPVHLVNGTWGMLAAGIFASGRSDTMLWNGVPTPVTGLLFGGLSQLVVQVIAIVVIFVIGYGVSFVFFKILDSMKLLRVSAKDELAGLDVTEMGSDGYPVDYEPTPDLIKQAIAAAD